LELESAVLAIDADKVLTIIPDRALPAKQGLFFDDLVQSLATE
jgi:hypothetical protein